MSAPTVDVTRMCHWHQNRHGAQDVTHALYHFGSPCPYEAVAAVLAGQPDPRDDVTVWEIDLPFAGGKPPMSLNDRQEHWAIHAKKVELVKAITRNAVRGADVPELPYVHVELHYRGRTNAVRDADNYVATLKRCIDALHQNDDRSLWVPIIAGDDARYVSWSQPVLHPAIRGAGAATWLVLRTWQTIPVQEALL